MIEHWIIPCNPKYFDIISYMENHTEVVFRRVSAVREGDIAYIYVASPYGEIKYRCRVVCDDVSESEVAENSYAIPQNKIMPNKKYRYVKLEKEYVFPERLLPLSELKKHGLGQVQVQARTDRRVQAYISEIETKQGIR